MDLMKDDAIKKDSEKVKQLLEELKKKDTIVDNVMKELHIRADSMRSAYKHEAVVDWIKNDDEVRNWFAAAGIGFACVAGFQVLHPLTHSMFHFCLHSTG